MRASGVQHVRPGDVDDARPVRLDPVLLAAVRGLRRSLSPRRHQRLGEGGVVDLRHLPAVPRLLRLPDLTGTTDRRAEHAAGPGRAGAAGQPHQVRCRLGLRGADRQSEGAARQRCDHPARVRAAEGESSGVTRRQVGGAWAWSAGPTAARARARSRQMCTPAEVRGAASTRPTIPRMQPALIVMMSTASGCRSRAEPIANGWKMFWSRPFARMTITSMTSAFVVPSAPSAIRTANAPDTNAPM